MAPGSPSSPPAVPGSDLAGGVQRPVTSPGHPLAAGHAPEDALAAPPGRTVSVKPALVVIAVVAVITVGGALLALFGQGGAPASGPARRLPGVALAGVAAKQVLRPIATGGEPPADVLGSLAVPQGARRTSSGCTASVELYDCRVELSVDASPDDVVAFYQAELAHSKWSKIAVDATANGQGTEILERRASSDGFYWEVGVIVDPVAPAVSPALGGGGQTAPTSSVELRVFEIDDAD